jgi:NADH-ubiquinone oxidoreductase chain 3
MASYILIIITPIIISSLLIRISYIVSIKSRLDREKTRPFECGFDPKSTARLPFSLRFFLLAVIFLVFDVEIALLLPLPLSFTQTLLSSTIFSAFIFFIILLLGLLHE